MGRSCLGRQGCAAVSMDFACHAGEFFAHMNLLIRLLGTARVHTAYTSLSQLQNVRETNYSAASAVHTRLILDTPDTWNKA